MFIRKIESPSWSGDIKEILTPHSASFEFSGVSDDQPLNYEWWEIRNGDGLIMGIGWIDIDQNEFGQIEAEISLCMSSGNKGQKVGSTLLAFLENEITKRKINITSALVKKSNPEHDSVVNWFNRRNYKIEHVFDSDTYLIKK
ncbi:hypothetical protein [Bacillus wiedmannii]|uniref:hypothetical protein n=1 Tax=Bacillus wiedmannii TaxID=1890302 RepID=UPI000BF4DAC6|nr:hypothetical protein [Bacillus wiedmannii]PGD70261.1 hypothetical protein COM44_12555 [Bacillus wiedmannii]